MRRSFSLRFSFVLGLLAMTIGTLLASEAEESFFFNVGAWEIQGDRIRVEAPEIAGPVLSLFKNGVQITGPVEFRKRDIAHWWGGGVRTEYEVVTVSPQGAQLICRQLKREGDARERLLRRSSSKLRANERAQERPSPLVLVRETVVKLPSKPGPMPVILWTPLIAVEGSDGEGWRTR